MRASRRGVAAHGPAAVGLLLTTCLLLAAFALRGLVSPVLAETKTETADITPEQAARARSIEEKLVAVCCFRQALAEHQSERADAMRNEIRSKLAAGATDEEIVSYFVSKYGERVLVAPEARGFNVLAYIMPAVAVVAGLMIILVFVRHARKEEPAIAAPAPAEGPSAADPDADLRARMAEELDRFDV